MHHVTIIPRSNGAGGFTMPLPEEDRAYRTRRYMEEYLVVCLAGRVAEELTMDDVSTGAYGDIKQATAMARAMVVNYGFSDKIGPVDYDVQGGEIFLGRDFAAGKDTRTPRRPRSMRRSIASSRRPIRAAARCWRTTVNS